MSNFYIFADIETDALRGDRLLQIAAVADNGEEFNKFINPHQRLLESCTNITGLHFYHGRLYQNGIYKPTVSITRSLISFRDWLEHFNKPVTLVFHNGFSFDCKILARHYLKLNITPPKDTIKIVDTLPGFRKHFKNPEPANHKLVTLTEFFEIPKGLAHDALYDSQVLKAICERAILKYDITLDSLLGCSKERNFDYYIKKELEGPGNKNKQKSTDSKSSQQQN